MKPPLRANYRDKFSHTYAEDERKIIIDKLTEIVFDKRQAFVLIAFDRESPPELVTNTTLPTFLKAIEFIVERAEGYFSEKNGEVLVEDNSRDH